MCSLVPYKSTVRYFLKQKLLYIFLTCYSLYINLCLSGINMLMRTKPHSQASVQTSSLADPGNLYLSIFIWRVLEGNSVVTSQRSWHHCCVGQTAKAWHRDYDQGTMTSLLCSTGRKLQIIYVTEKKAEAADSYHNFGSPSPQTAIKHIILIPCLFLQNHTE